MSGAVSVAVGTLAVAFAKTSFKRTTRELSTIDRLWKQDMTIAQLKRTALDNLQLPSLVLMKGRLNARGPPVRTATTQIRGLQTIVGTIDQPKNYYRNLFFKRVQLEAREGEKGLPTPGWISPEEMKKLNVEDDFSQRQGYIDDFLVSELFVTRLGCEASIRKVKHKNGRVETIITRQPK